jgi:hypothetical protein
MKRPAPMVGAGGADALGGGAAPASGATLEATGGAVADSAGGMPEDVSIGARGVAAGGTAGGATVTARGVTVIAGGAVAIAPASAEVTFVVPAGVLPLGFGPPVLSLTGVEGGGAGTTGAITMVGAAAGAGAGGSAAVVSTIDGSSGSRRAWSRSRHETTIIVDRAAPAATPAMIVQSVFCRAKRASALSHRGFAGSMT